MIGKHVIKQPQKIFVNGIRKEEHVTVRTSTINGERPFSRWKAFKNQHVIMCDRENFNGQRRKAFFSTKGFQESAREVWPWELQRSTEKGLFLDERLSRTDTWCGIVRTSTLNGERPFSQWKVFKNQHVMCDRENFNVKRRKIITILGNIFSFFTAILE